MKIISILTIFNCRIFVVICLTLFLSACNSLSEKVNVEGKEEALFRRGIVSLQDQQLVFQPCYTRKQEPVTDHTNRLISYLANQFNPRVYAEVSGTELRQSSPWGIYKVHVLGGHSATCHFELQGNLFRAAGSNPIWIADVQQGAIYVQNDKGLTKLRFPASEPERSVNTLVWQSTLQTPNLYNLHLRLKLQSCRDAHGIEYEYSARMKLNDKVFKGCARQGDLGQRTLPGLYEVKVAVSDRYQQHISMHLMADGQVAITQDYLNQQPIYKQQGRWELLPKNKVAVYLISEQQDGNDVLVFHRHRLGGLVMQGYSAVYGKAGLTFQRIGPALGGVNEGPIDYKHAAEVEKPPQPPRL